ncbi:LysR family transcriptional regulator [Nibrella viscosa]|uniref:LysR family transcriptional regulator n=2 Tax=Nibrella viscosa TaxID=1084524 RepID=A0ABP8JY33_9BACT
MEVARQLSFTRASQTLYISQSALSKQVKALEHFYKTALFERHGSSISLTPAGQLLFQKLHEASLLEQDLQWQLQSLNESFQPNLKLAIGASTTITLYVLPPILSAYLRQFPGRQVHVLNRNSNNIQKALLEHEIDVGIVEELPRVNTIVYTPFIEDHVLAVCSKQSPLKDQRLTIADLPAIPLALREFGSGTLAAVDKELDRHGLGQDRLQVIIRLGGTEALKNFVLADTCLAFLPRRAILRELASGDLVELPIENVILKRRFHFIQRQGTENNPLIREFIRFTQRQYSQKE